MRKLLCLVVGVAMIGWVSGCGPSSGASSSSPRTTEPAASTTSSTPTSLPSALPSAGPLTAAQYQAELAVLDGRLGPAYRAMIRANSAAGLSSTGNFFGTMLESESSHLSGLRPPARAVAANRALQQALAAAGSGLGGGWDTIAANASPKCGGVVTTAQVIQRSAEAKLRPAINQLTRLGLHAGAFLPKVPPLPAAHTPGNGDVLVRSGSRGYGRLQVDNGLSTDVAVSVVNGSPTSPRVMMYVKARKTATITRIGGGYNVYFKTGDGWNSRVRQFSSNCSFQKFDQPFGRNESWQIGLKPTILGNASTSDVDAF
jgi:hypothetical protein